MLEWVQKKVFTKYLGSVIRTALAALGGFLIAKYNLDADLVESLTNNLTEVLATILPILIAQVWSLIQKKGSKSTK